MGGQDYIQGRPIGITKHCTGCVIFILQLINSVKCLEKLAKHKTHLHSLCNRLNITDVITHRRASSHTQIKKFAFRLIVIDIDNFKQYNDLLTAHAHLAIKLLATKLAEVLGKSSSNKVLFAR